MASGATTSTPVRTATQKGALRWTLEKAAMEFGIHRSTLTKKLRSGDTEPGTDGRYSTQQIAAAIYNDADSERTRLYREQADRLAIANSKARAEQVDVETVFKAYEGVFISIRGTILASNLTDAEKAEILSNLRHDTTDAAPIE
jgi:phage terminase Nu1 subunit (DNA packaging protein)